MDRVMWVFAVLWYEVTITNTIMLFAHQSADKTQILWQPVTFLTFVCRHLYMIHISFPPY
jgi:hypothetical protein